MDITPSFKELQGIANIEPVGLWQAMDEEEQKWLDSEVDELFADLGLED